MNWETFTKSRSQKTKNTFVSQKWISKKTLFPNSRLRQDLESATRELGKLKDRHLEQAVKYSRALEEQGKASNRERELLSQVRGLQTACFFFHHKVFKLSEHADIDF